MDPAVLGSTGPGTWENLEKTRENLEKRKDFCKKCEQKSRLRRSPGGRIARKKTCITSNTSYFPISLHRETRIIDNTSFPEREREREKIDLERERERESHSWEKLVLLIIQVLEKLPGHRSGKTRIIGNTSFEEAGSHG